MIEHVAAKNVDTAVTNQNSEIVYIKLLNFLPGSAKALRTDQLAVTNPDGAIVAGDILTTDSGLKYTVIDLTKDYFRSRQIRHSLSMITANNAVTVIRPTVTSNGQGGISGQTTTSVAISVPCKVGTASMLRDDATDLTLNRFILLLSKLYPVQIGDTIRFASYYDDAKVEGIKYDAAGVQEIVFDRDPRWKSA